jgi:defect-in-organelle-trafficking protein DotC
MVSAPYVAHSDLGVTGNRDKLRVGDQVLRITALPQLNTAPKTWQPAVVDKYDS